MVQTGPYHRSGAAAHSTRAGSRAKSRKPQQPTTPLGLLREGAIVLVVALVLASLLRAFIVQAFMIPSGSMENTLLCKAGTASDDGGSCTADTSDRVVVSKLSNHLGGIDRGDVVVFADPDHWLPNSATPRPTGLSGVVRRGIQFIGLVPDDATGHLIKRVIGVGGDRVRTDADGHVLVNGRVLQEDGYLKAGTPASSDCSFDVTVPAGSLWVMGDNRDNSSDSRLHQRQRFAGMVPLSLVTGRAVARVWPVGRVGGLGVPDSFEDIPAAGSDSSTGSLPLLEGACRDRN